MPIPFANTALLFVLSTLYFTLVSSLSCSTTWTDWRLFLADLDLLRAGAGAYVLTGVWSRIESCLWMTLLGVSEFLASWAASFCWGISNFLTALKGFWYLSIEHWFNRVGVASYLRYCPLASREGWCLTEKNAPLFPRVILLWKGVAGEAATESLGAAKPWPKWPCLSWQEAGVLRSRTWVRLNCWAGALLKSERPFGSSLLPLSTSAGEMSSPYLWNSWMFFWSIVFRFLVF